MFARFVGLSLALAAVLALTRADAASPSLAPAGWMSSYADARRVAQQQNKPVLLLQMFGKLNEEFC